MSKRKLLLADDSITIQKVVNLTFADEGIEVISVGDGNSAMDKIREESPDLIMADVNMPGLNGYEICEKVRQSDEYKRTPVILLVGSFEPFDEAEAKRVGADDFLKKPFQSINQLVTTVTVLLDSESAASYGDPSGDPSPETIDSDDDDEFYGMNATTQEFADPRIDDEMIETSHGVPTESTEFASDEDTEEHSKEASYEEVQEEDVADDDFKEFSIDGSNETPVYSNEEVTNDELGSDDSAYSFEPEESYDTDLSGYDSADESVNNDVIDDESESAGDEIKVHLDETNLLELPFENDPGHSSSETETLETDEEFGASLLTNEADVPGISEDQEPENLTEENDPPDYEESNDTETSSGSDHFQEHVDIDNSGDDDEEEQAFEANGISSESVGITSEMIDEIARRVVERLSGDALKDVAREVVPEMAERIIRQIAEEKMND